MIWFQGGSPEFALPNQAMLSLKNQFEFVFLDLPPYLHSTHSKLLTRLCDGVVLVVQAGRTRWQTVAETRRLLEKANIPILGGVLNRREFSIPELFYRML